MTKLSDLGPPPIIEKRQGKDNEEETNLLHKCGECGQIIDLRDLRQVIWHDKPGHEPLEMDD